MKKRIWLLCLLGAVVGGTALLVVLFLLQEQAVPPRQDLTPVTAPQGTQLLIFPIDHGVVTAGYQNANYREKFGYPHYGIDITSADGGRAPVVASGEGLVLGTEFCDNNLGSIAVIRYDSVFLPETGETVPLVARYYHMTQLLVREGDRVGAGQAIGAIDGRHQWYNHIHLELDADVDYPFHTPQVAESSSELLHRYPADGEQILEPLWVLAAGDGQQVSARPASRLCTEKDEPRYRVEAAA